jgi:hypothetical protein
MLPGCVHWLSDSEDLCEDVKGDPCWNNGTYSTLDSFKLKVAWMPILSGLTIETEKNLESKLYQAAVKCILNKGM